MNDVYVSGSKVQTQADSVNIYDAVEERSVCSFVVIDVNGSYEFKKGMPVYINNNMEWENAYETWSETEDTWATEDTYFTGFIDKVLTRQPDPNGVYYHYITCVDSHYLADKRLIAEAYEDMRADLIVQDILTNYLADEGITEGVIEQGSTILEAVFNYVSATDALNVLCEKSGFWWNIDQDRQLNFRARSGNASPFDIDTSEIVIMKDSIEVEESNPKYRNKQYVKGSKDITDSQPEVRKGDGENQAFVVSYPIALEPTVEIDVGAGYVSQTVGIRGVDTGKDWYWLKGSDTVTQESSDTALTASDTIKITYQGEFDIIVVVQDESKILDRQDTEETGTGIVESVYDDRSLTSRESAFDVANSKLKKFSEISKIVRFTTIEKSFRVGQIANVNLPGYGITNEEFLVSKINIYTEDRGRNIFYEIEAVKGEDNDSWTKFFDAMAKASDRAIIRENISEDEILATVEEFSKDWESTESPNIFTSTVASETTFPGASTYPMFATADKVKYVAWYVGGSESGRKLVTKRTDSTDEIFTISYLGPLEANVSISHMGWFGGTEASITVGTGVEIDKQVYVNDKTELESIQIEKTDTNIDSPTASGTELTPDYLNAREDAIYDLVDYAETQGDALVASSL